MAQSPDIRVRLSAEGQKDIIDALRQVAAEAEVMKRKVEESNKGLIINQRVIAAEAARAKKEAQALTQGEIRNQEQVQIAVNKTLVSKARIAKLTDAQAAGQLISPASIKTVDAAAASLGSLSGLIPKIGFAAVAFGLLSMAKNAGNFADEMGKAAQRAGTSAENISVLAFAANNANVQFEVLEKSLPILISNLAELRKGSLAQVDAFDELGLGAADFAGKDSAAAFDLIAGKISRLTDETKKVEVARAIFGRGGAQLIPLLNDLGTKGFAKVREEAERLGLVISTDLARASDAANTSMGLIAAQVKGLAVQFITGLAPAVTQTMTSFQDDTAGKGAESMKAFGNVAGKVLGLVVNGFRLIATVIGTVIGGIGRSVGALAAATGAVFSGEFTEAGNIMKERFKDIGAEVDGLAKDIREGLGKALFDLAADAPAVDVQVKATVAPDTADQAAATIQKQIEDKLAQLSTKVGAGEFENIKKLAQQRQQIAEDEIKNQEALAQARASSSKGLIAGEAAITAASDAALKARVENTRKAYDTEIQLSQAKAAALSQAVDTEVKNVNSRAQLKTEITKRSNQEQLQSAAQYYSKLLALNTEWLQRYKAANEAIKGIDREIQDNRLNVEKTFNDIRKAGLSEDERFRATRREAIELEGQLQKAVAAGNIEDARRLQKELVAAGAELAKLGGERIGREFADDATAQLNRLLEKEKQVQQQTKTTAEQNIQSLSTQLEEAKAKVAELAAEGLGDIKLKIILDDPAFDDLISQLKEKLSKEPFPINVTANLSAPTQAFAGGGRIPGVSPHPRADDKLILATSGEFMQPVRAVRYYGLDFMEQIRRMQLPRMADGGIVGATPGAPAAAGGGDVQRLDINFNKRQIGQVSGSRETLRNFMAMMDEVSRGVDG